MSADASDGGKVVVAQSTDSSGAYMAEAWAGEGTHAGFSAMADPGYAFKRWTGPSAYKLTYPNLSFQSIDIDHDGIQSLHAEFVKSKEFYLKIKADNAGGGKGYVNVTPKQKYYSSDTVISAHAVEESANECCVQFDHWSGHGKTISNEPIDGNTSHTIYFEAGNGAENSASAAIQIEAHFKACP